MAQRYFDIKFSLASIGNILGNELEMGEVCAWWVARKWTSAELRDFDWNSFRHPPDFPDLTPPDFYLFPVLKKCYKEENF